MSKNTKNLSSETVKSRNPYLDIVKLIAAFCVVFIHANASAPASKNPSILLYLIQVIVRFAVPFFFMVSGYFTFRAPAEKIKKRLKRTAILIAIANILYFVLCLFCE